MNNNKNNKLVKVILYGPIHACGQKHRFAYKQKNEIEYLKHKSNHG